MLSPRINWEHCEIHAVHCFIRPEELTRFPFNSIDLVERGYQEFPDLSLW
jgi:hypothetical protein